MNVWKEAFMSTLCFIDNVESEFQDSQIYLLCERRRYMKEEMIRSQAMATAGKLSQEEQKIGELGMVQSPDITIQTTFLTIFCC